MHLLDHPYVSSVWGCFGVGKTPGLSPPPLSPSTITLFDWTLLPHTLVRLVVRFESCHAMPYKTSD